MVYIRPRLASLTARGGHRVGCVLVGLLTFALCPLAGRPHGMRTAHSGYASGCLPPGVARDEEGLPAYRRPCENRIPFKIYVLAF